MDELTLNKAKELIELTNGQICNHCLGRKFSDCVEGDGNVERGVKIREALNLPTIEEDKDYKECEICHDLFNEINSDLVEIVKEKIESLEVEFDSFVVGCWLTKEIAKKDEEISSKLGLDVEVIKKEINREFGKLLEANRDIVRTLKQDTKKLCQAKQQLNSYLIKNGYV